MNNLYCVSYIDDEEDITICEYVMAPTPEEAIRKLRAHLMREMNSIERIEVTDVSLVVADEEIIR